MADIKTPPEPIALVGNSCRFTGDATSPSKLWQLLANPTDLSRPVPANRFSATGFFHQDAEHHGTTNSPHGYWLSQDLDKFDATFFNITRKEAEAMDPQQRLLLEVVYEALESAGYTLKSVAGRHVGVYTGVMTTDYRSLSERDELNASQYAATGNASSIIANRISYFYDFHGPSMTIDTACSASLVALHQAVLGLRAGETEMACVAGVNLMLTPEQFISESDLHMLSPTGHCRMWDSMADGYARGEGVIAFFIKTLTQALADGDNIQAIIRHTGVNSDGKSQGITLPNPTAQTALIRKTYEMSGTGTPAGDPREARAIAEAFFGDGHQVASTNSDGQPQKLLVGSIKTIIGHTEGAAGLAGVLKVILAMNNTSVPRNLHHDSLNPTVRPHYENLQIPSQTLGWPSPPAGHPMRASVNSFGFGGTNAHAIVEKYQPDTHGAGAKSRERRTNQEASKSMLHPLQEPGLTLPLVITAASEASFVAVLNDLISYIDRTPQITALELAWHLDSRRTAHSLKTFLVAGPGKAASMMSGLQSLVDRASNTSLTQSGAIIRSKKLPHGPRILGIFTGQGAQYAAMSKGLLRTNATYRATIQKLDLVLKTECLDPPEWSLEEKIMTEGPESDVGVAAIAQPLCTAIQIALVELLVSLGLSFHCVVGHSSGEIAAAFAAKRLSMRDAILIAYYRGRCAHLATGANGIKGGMMACGMSKHKAQEFCSRPDYQHRICVAASNSPTLVTLSGDVDAITTACGELQAAGKLARILKVDTAYHSFHMAGPVEEYSEALASSAIEAQPYPTTTGTAWVSSVYGTPDAVTPEDLAIDYWKNNMLQPVLFHEAMCVALDKFGPFDCAIEVGPHPQLKTPALETMKSSIGTELPYHGVLQRGKQADIAFAESLGFVCINFGTSAVDIRRFVHDSSQPELVSSRLIDAPTYPWDHAQIYWRESRLSAQYHFREQPPHELLGVRTRDDNQFQMRWRNILKAEQIPWVNGHKFQGQALLPASAYCVMALDAAKFALGGRKASIVELQDIRFLSGITIESGSLGVEVLFTLSVLTSSQSRNNNTNVMEADFTLTSVPITPYKHSQMQKNFEGKVIAILGDPSPSALPHRHLRPTAETLPVNVVAFHQMMEGIGLSYTGPFQALRSIDRRFDYATGTLSKSHPLDTTHVDVSPAFLDSCFQATFATFSSPGDKALWTSFLPTKIGRIRFNLALCGEQRLSADMTVESHLTKLEPYSFYSPATITADLNITNKFGQTEVQLQDLVVSSFSSAKPEDDYELYLHTVLDLDPEHEIITMSPEPRGVGKHIDESCDIVAQMYLKQSTRIPPAGTPLISPPASPPTTPPSTPMRLECPGQGLPDAPFPEQVSVEVGDEMEQFISSSPFFYALKLILNPRVVELPRTNPLAFPSVYQSIVDDTHLIHNFRTHLGRVVQQIGHRFPRMNVLDLTFAEWAFTENVLDGLQDTFSSYKLMASTQPQALLNRCPALSSNKVSFEELDLDTQSDDTTNATGAYDLVVMSTAIFSRFGLSKREIIRKIRLLLRMRGFLIIIHSPSMLAFENRFDRSDALFNQSSSDLVTPLDLDALLHGSMFSPAVENSTQSHISGFSMTIRQANDDLQAPTFKRGRSIESVVIVGHPAARFGLERHKAIHHIRVQKNLEAFDNVEDVTPKAASAATVVILLMDLTDPICSNMTAEALSALKSLMQPGKVVLWVTRAALRDPETAASFGLTRTLKAENPDLILQVLDSYNTASISTDLIVDQIMLLLHYRDHIHGDGDLRRKMLFSFESEIHVNGKRRIVPRVLPYRPAIDRLNANRREVSRTFNSLETSLRIGSARGSDELTRFEVRPVEECSLCLANQPTGRFVDVEYSSLYPISPSLHDLYLSVGLATDNGRPVVGLSPYSASKASVLQTIDISQSFSDRRGLASLLMPMVSAAGVGTWARPGDIVLIEPDLTFLHCIRAVLPLGGEFTIHALTTDRDLAKDHANIKYFHPMSSGRELKRLIPRTNPTVIDFLADGNGLSKIIEGLAGNFEYVRWPPSSTVRRDQQFLIDPVMWTDLLTRCLNIVGCMPSQNPKSTFVTPALLYGTSESTSAFTLVDWKSNRHVPVPVKPLVELGMLKPDRTYILVGLTRDLGQSLCRLFIQHGARNIVVASRSPNNAAIWISELNSEGANIRAQKLDVTNLESVKSLRASLPNVGGIVNGAMVLDDRVFAQMDIDTWRRVTRPKTVGSSNLDKVFKAKDLDFFIMMSSFAAIGGHAGQSNYAAANMFMNGLATNRRERGFVGSVLNIGVIYGLGLLARERQDIYHGLEREGYPPISERDIHHMFLEAIVAGRPTPGQIMDLTTGLARYRVNDPNPLHWHRDSRFCHFTVDEADDDGPQRNKDDEKNLKELVHAAASAEAVSGLLSDHLCRHLEATLQLSENSISGESHIVELGVDSLMAVEIRNWFYKRVGSDVPVMKILKPLSISDLCLEIANKIVTERI
ncbi:Type I Iterative PKS [Diaporthe australafricana]|uniref:Type I Iterative PKS n=1 Tax=Diaporthe australafricana TaxID=127596 RepID=A0ABR3W211_9PEZI